MFTLDASCSLGAAKFHRDKDTAPVGWPALAILGRPRPVGFHGGRGVPPRQVILTKPVDVQRPDSGSSQGSWGDEQADGLWSRDLSVCRSKQNPNHDVDIPGIGSSRISANCWPNC